MTPACDPNQQLLNSNMLAQEAPRRHPEAPRGTHEAPRRHPGGQRPPGVINVDSS